ncbi:threonine ammonia-lyase, biosynthetic [Advenella alkanexedens]|jgi:threonine dehydratase|uniref:L-threonine dehydratase n=1 Tax=Advenella alkanexedens TaxID=1481665 RepID=A0ABS6NR51_9BURK|nr:MULTISPECIES: threonine ammonia-lyase, biosynthetic [Advenella]MBV4398091.1 threonine ammonia-lyase, biosynthetic [Advenella alkanexedens]MDD3758428.1 threonine ammonia-lyase, biosynthetic [Advenella sp.]NLN67058.1 threonine ammonia-lyase, biosynthetic [Alcaligenaceae bacterium]
MSTDYLKRILTSKVYDVATETPLEPAKLLSARIQNTILLKREDTQSVFSFKIRGAYNKMANISAEARAHGVICASAGNHAQGVALSAKKLGCRAVIAMPTSTPKVKIDAVKRLGGEVVLHGDSFTDAYEHALILEKEQNLTFVHPFDDPFVIAGQGTIAMEILRQHPGSLDAIFVSIGGGGLIAGIAAYIKQLRPEIKIIGVQTEDSDAMIRSVRAGRRVSLPDVGLFSDGTAVKQVGIETFRLVKEYVDDFIAVDTDAICAALKDVFQDTRSVLEPAGALALAGAKRYIAEHKWKNKTVAVITSGANMNFDRLRFVAERADVGEAKEAIFAVTMPEVKGSFKQLCTALGARNVTEFNYRISDANKAHVFVGVQINSQEEAEKVADRLRRKKFDVLDLTADDLAKSHLRYMVGGHSSLAENEVLYRFEFPERPGALMKFLDTMNPEWNISLFHYRNQGADYGRVLVGIQVPPADKKAFRDFLSTIGYPFVKETDNPAYKLFL